MSVSVSYIFPVKQERKVKNLHAFQIHKALPRHLQPHEEAQQNDLHHRRCISLHQHSQWLLPILLQHTTPRNQLPNSFEEGYRQTFK